MKTLFWAWMVLSSLNIGYTAYQKTGNPEFGLKVGLTWTIALPTVILDTWQRTR